MTAETGTPRRHRKVPWLRILAELVAISVGVFLGLLADDYRDHRAEQAREREYLRALALDLDADLQTLGYTRDGILAQALAVDRIRGAVVDETIEPGTINPALSVLILTWTYEPQRPTYLALRDGLGIHIISELSLRSALLSYYEVDQLRLLQDYMHNYSVVQQRLRQSLNRHVRFLPPEDYPTLQTVPEDFNVARLATTMDVMGADLAFMNDLAELGGRAFELVREIERVQALNRSLRKRIPAESR